MTSKSVIIKMAEVDSAITSIKIRQLLDCMKQPREIEATLLDDYLKALRQLEAVSTIIIGRYGGDSDGR